MMKQFCQHVNKLSEKTLLKTESLLLLSGDLPILTSTLQSISPITFRNNEQLEKIVCTYNTDSFEKIEDGWRTFVVINSGVTRSCDQDLTNLLEDYINGQKEDQKRAERDARG